MTRCLIIIFFLLVSPVFAQDSVLSDIISICNEEIQLYADKNDIIPGKKRYMIPQWQIFKQKDSAVLMLIIKHNFYWLGFFSGSLVDEPKTAQAILYGKYDDKVGWVWHERSRLSALPQTRAEIAKELLFVEKIKPLGIIASNMEGFRRSIAIRYLCKEFINKHLFYSGNGHN